jgi:zinc transport system ATP-binding protein
MSLITIDSVSYDVEGRSILENISFSIAAGEIVTMIGPNGSGKTTLVKIILNLLRATTGAVHRGRPLSVGYAPQSLNIDQYLPLTASAFIKSTISSQLSLPMVVELTDIGNLLQSQLCTLSGGELKRVLLAKALLTGRDVIFLDEPVSCLDLNQKDNFYNILKNVNRSLGCAIVLVSHDLLMIMRYTDKIVCINRHLCCVDSPRKVAAHPSFVKLFGHGFQNIVLHDHEHHCQETC